MGYLLLRDLSNHKIHQLMSMIVISVEILAYHYIYHLSNSNRIDIVLFHTPALKPPVIVAVTYSKCADDNDLFELVYVPISTEVILRSTYHDILIRHSCVLAAAIQEYIPGGILSFVSI